MIKALQDIRISPMGWIKAGIYAIILAFVYLTALSQLLMHDWYKEDYTHCMLIPFVVLYLVWEKRQELNSVPSQSSWVWTGPVSHRGSLLLDG